MWRRITRHHKNKLYVVDASFFCLNKKFRRNGSSQAGMEHIVRNACKRMLPINQSAEGATEKTLSCLRHFDIGLVMNAGVPCCALHRLPGNCRHYVTFQFVVFLCVFARKNISCQFV